MLEDLAVVGTAEVPPAIFTKTLRCGAITPLS
jgi:hypothetical protein